MESYASDLNPVAVLINKSMIEIPPIFSGQPPVNPDSLTRQAHSGSWSGSQGMAEDISYYGKWVRDEAEKRIGFLYPKIEITNQMIEERADLKKYSGQSLTVIAWIWARTVKSPNPAFADVDVPLVSNFMLSSKDGKEAYVEPAIEGGKYKFLVKTGRPPEKPTTEAGTSAGKRAGFLCLMSGTPLTYNYIREEGSAGRMGSKLMAIVAEGDRGRIYLSPTQEMELLASAANPTWRPDTQLDGKCRVNVSNYGIDVFGDLFTSRQLVSLTTFCDLIQDAKSKVREDALLLGLGDEGVGLEGHGNGATAYAEAISVYLACALGKLADYNSTICSWISGGQTMRNTFGRQAIPMMWDYAEANVLSDSTGGYLSCLEQVRRVVTDLPSAAQGFAVQNDAQTQSISLNKVISTDPPYFDNIEYADLSDYFYVWMRRSLRPIFPSLFSTVAVPKAEELVATPFRHGGKELAEKFFLSGMTEAMLRLSQQAHPAFPVTIYYAFKQSESDDGEGTTNTGWDTFLAAVIKAGFSVTGTWPMRTEMGNRMIGSGANALASSIVLVCRRRSLDAPTVSRREFISELKNELPNALIHLQAGNIAPVDLAQAAIGPGMAVFTKYSNVLDSEGKSISVRSALSLINQTLDDALTEQEGDIDSESRFALAWFDQFGFTEGEFGVADVLARAKATSVDGVSDAGIILSGKGKVRLLKPKELPVDWEPMVDERITSWEVVHQLIRELEATGERGVSKLVSQLGDHAEIARELCYRLYALCEKRKRASEAMSYNALVQSWPEIMRLAAEGPRSMTQKTDDLFNQE